MTWLGPDGGKIEVGEDEGGRLVQTVLGRTSRSMLRLPALTLADAGQYRVRVATADLVQEEKFLLVVTDPPRVTVVAPPAPGGLYRHGSQQTIRCTATGFPAPVITWTFKPCEEPGRCESDARPIAASSNKQR